MNRNRDDTSLSPISAAWEWTGLALCLGVFLLLRLPLYTNPGLSLGWHSDAALFGLMARAIAAGDFPFLFWGCDYLAPLTSVFAVAVSAGSTHEIGPLALRLGVGLEVFGALAFFYLAGRRIVGGLSALLSTFWLCAGPAFLFKLTYAPLSAEQYFFVGAVVFWYVSRAPFASLHQWLALGLLTGLGWWIHRGVIFVVIPALITIICFEARSYRVGHAIVAACIFAAGAALGYVPVALGKLAVDQRLYTPVQAPWSLGHVQERIIETVKYDIWTFLGADEAPMGVLLGATLLVLFARAAWRIRLKRETFFAAVTIATCVAFWLLSTHSYRGAVRYIIIALPIVYTFAAAEVVCLWQQSAMLKRAASVVAAVIVTAALFVTRHNDVRDIVAARREQHEKWPGGFDPRPTLKVLAATPYTVCYADVWVAHKLEWLGGVRFIPYRSVNRRMVESLRLAALHGPKCFVDLEGHVYTLTQEQETMLRLETLWHARGWRRNVPQLQFRKSSSVVNTSVERPGA